MVVGSMVRIEFAKFLHVEVLVESIVDGVLYGTAEDGEPYCAPLANCEAI